MGADQQQGYPFTPRSATALTVGDLIPVQGDTAGWACLQVLELAPRARSYFIVGLLDWRGSLPPGPADVRAAAPLRRAMTRIEVFTEGGLEVVGNSAPADEGQERFFGPGYIGKRTQTWGWMAAVTRGKRQADGLEVL